MSLAEAMKIDRQIKFVEKTMTNCDNKTKLLARLEADKQLELATAVDLTIIDQPPAPPPQTPPKKG